MSRGVTCASWRRTDARSTDVALDFAASRRHASAHATLKSRVADASDASLAFPRLNNLANTANAAGSRDAIVSRLSPHATRWYRNHVSYAVASGHCDRAASQTTFAYVFFAISTASAESGATTSLYPLAHSTSSHLVASWYGFAKTSLLRSSATSALGKHSSARKKHGSTISTPVQQHRMPRVLSVKFLRTSATNCERALFSSRRVHGRRAFGAGDDVGEGDAVRK